MPRRRASRYRGVRPPLPVAAAVLPAAGTAAPTTPAAARPAAPSRSERRLSWWASLMVLSFRRRAVRDGTPGLIGKSVCTWLAWERTGSRRPRQPPIGRTRPVRPEIALAGGGEGVVEAADGRGLAGRRGCLGGRGAVPGGPGRGGRRHRHPALVPDPARLRGPPRDSVGTARRPPPGRGHRRGPGAVPRDRGPDGVAPGADHLAPVPPPGHGGGRTGPPGGGARHGRRPGRRR